MIEDSCRMLRAASSRLQTLRAICGLSRRRFILMIAIGQLAALDAMGGVAANPFRALPLAFEQNQGQADPRAKYLTRGAAMEMFFLTDATRLVKHDSASSSVLDIRLVGARTNVEPLGTNLLPQRTSHIKGAAPSDNVTDIRAFAGVRYEAIYPGIDLVYYGTGGELEYDLLVMPHANPGMIQLAFEGAQSIRLSDAGNLILGTESGDVEFRRPVAYQDIGGERCPVAASYVLTPRKEVAFQLGEYDRDHRLVIDPVLSLSTSLWGNAAGVALDSARNIYVVGSIWNSGLPASNGYQTQLGGSQDAYVIKLNPSGTAVLYATYLGARRVTTTGSSIAVDGAGSAYVTGTTANGFPVTPGAYLSSGTTFITKLNPAGNGLVYSTYVTAPVVSLAVDSAGQTYMTGTATTLTTTPGSL
ncbi:MAG TPA: SBBP repeat-containing protein, partial [Gemmatimonadaceae bacterium]